MQWFTDHYELIIAIVGFIVGLIWQGIKIARDFKESQSLGLWSYLLDKGEDYLKQLQAQAVREIQEEDVASVAFFLWDAAPEKMRIALSAFGFSREKFAVLLWARWQSWCDVEAGMARAGLISLDGV
jgi:hypothetical protein